MLPDLHGATPWRQSLSPLFGERRGQTCLVRDICPWFYERFGSYKQGTNFRAWIYRILHNTFLTTQTGLKAQVSLDDDDRVIEPETDTTPESILLAQAAQETVRQALEELPLKSREVILLCDMEEMSYEEIAQTLAIPIGTVMSRLSRARRAMRALLAAKLQGGIR